MRSKDKRTIMETIALVYLSEDIILSADPPNGKRKSLRIKTGVDKRYNGGECFYIYDHRIKTVTHSNDIRRPITMTVRSRARVEIVKKDNGIQYINLFDTDQKRSDLVLREICFPPEQKRQSKIIWSIGGYSSEFYAIALEDLSEQKTALRERRIFSLQPA